MGTRDFSVVRGAMQRYVDADVLPGVSWAVLAGRELVEEGCAGWADKEAKVALRRDHIFRVFSNTKLVTTCAALLLYEEGHFELDDPIERYLPELANRRVLRPGATRADDTEPAAGPITLRHLMSHSAGLSYGLLDPGTLIFKLYNEAGALDPGTTLAVMVERLATLPLVFHPGTGWEYSMATDVLGRLVEILGGMRFDEFLRRRVFEPLGMVDTGFVVPQADRPRFTAYYAGADLVQPMLGGLTRLDAAPYPGAYLVPVPRLSGGGGLVSTLPDMVALIRALMPGGALLRPQTLALMKTNQLAAGACVRFPRLGAVQGKGYGLAGAVTVHASAGAVGELEWGGIAGTHWWISPEATFAGLAMTQRQMAFWHPFSFEFKKLAYQAMRAGG